MIKHLTRVKLLIATLGKCNYLKICILVVPISRQVLNHTLYLQHNLQQADFIKGISSFSFLVNIIDHEGHSLDLVLFGIGS